MNYKNLKINEQEISKIELAETEICEICKKYNVYLEGFCDAWDSEYDVSYKRTTTTLVVKSIDFEDRIAKADKAYELQYAYEKQDSLIRFLKKCRKDCPNYLNLEVYKKVFVEPSGWRHDALFVNGLKVKDRDKIKEPIFWWNPNKFWQYDKGFKNDETRAAVSMWIYPDTDEPLFVSYPGNIDCKLYEEYKSKSDVLSHRFLIEMVDELIGLGVLELIK